MKHQPHFRFFWGYWHVYRWRNRGLIGAAKTLQECFALYREYLAQLEVQKLERKKPKRTTPATGKRPQPRSHRSK